MSQRQSSTDMVAFVTMVKMKLRKVLRKNPQIFRTKENLTLDETLKEVCNRFDKDQFWHTDNEVARIKSLADWVLGQHCIQEGVPFRPYQFDPQAMIAKKPLTKSQLTQGMVDLAYREEGHGG